jgi:membrane protease YdiL (CAAX protease family)
VKPSRKVELFFALALVLMAVLGTAANIAARPEPGAAPTDALTELNGRVKELPRVQSFLGLWLGFGLIAAAGVNLAILRKLRRGEKIEDAIHEPPPWSILDFTVVFLVTIAATQIAVPRERVELADGRTFPLGKKPVPVLDTTFEIAKGAVVASGTIVVNGTRFVGETRLARGDHFVVGGVEGVLLPTTAHYLGMLSLASLVGPLLALGVVRARGGRLADLGLVGFSIREVARGLVGYLSLVPGFFLLMILSAVLCRALGVPFEGHPLLEGLETDRNPLTLALLLVLTVVIAPLGEEILFRGLLLRSMRSAFGSLALGILASSFFFGALHPGLASLFPIGWVGAVCAALYATSPRRSILASMICHGLFNGVNVALEYVILKSLG